MCFFLAGFFPKKETKNGQKWNSGHLGEGGPKEFGAHTGHWKKKTPLACPDSGPPPGVPLGFSLTKFGLAAVQRPPEGGVLRTLEQNPEGGGEMKQQS